MNSNNSAHPNLPESAIRLVFLFKNQMLKALASSGVELSVMHVQTLKVLERCGPSTHAELVDVLLRDKAQVTRLVQTLAQRSIVQKRPHPTDKRSVVLELTTEGRRLLETIAETEQAVVERMTAGLTAEEVHQFDQLAARMQDNLAGEGMSSCIWE
ncbi:MAG: MarR family transcriptional regulator [Myxococcota bacterium]